MGVHACQRAGVKLGSKVLVCGAGEDKDKGGGVGGPINISASL